MNNKLVTRWSLSLAVLSVVLAAPALAVDTRKTPTKASDALATPDAPAAVLLPGMHGEGTGTWRAPSKSAGRLRAISRVGQRGPEFAFDAAITQVLPTKGSDGPAIGGDIVGEVLAVDRENGTQRVALLVGKWSQEADGQGSFVAHIFVPSNDPKEPRVAIGRCFGPIDAPLPGSGSAKKGAVTLRWDVQ